MKKILGLAFGLMIGAFAFSQSPVSFAEDLNNYSKATASEYHFTMDQSITAESITQNAQYYTDYFTVSSSAVAGGGNEVKISIVQDDAIARKVIMRYLVQFDIQAVNVAGSEMPLTEFMDTYIYQ